ncbi:MAG TPA: class I SAM-dependent DNA methyltransferase [Nitrospirae bacterium]|nr:class I SAM-dependent DNA methyltransferase [Nitrospirota bacterium]
MDKQQAQQIIRETFENSFDKNRFAGFIKNLLNRIEDAPFTYQGNYIPDAYKQYIKTLERIGKFSDGENSFDILVITLQKETSLERARTMQRNFIAWYLNGSRGGEMKDAALAAFVSPDEEDWRFSLVKMDYKFEKSATGRMKVKEEFTPARRWSFLVGANEKSHTAQSRLVNILANDEQAPTLDEIEKSFDIETVTKEFFLKYRELFLDAKKELDEIVEKDEKIKTDFIRNDVSTVDFCKKLLGQIVFLYFLQKKGWFGVKRGKEWGTGSKHFLRELFQQKHGDYQYFFNDILEPLFYEALAGERTADFYSRFDCKIPFLNGGLFDPINNYDWVHTDILLPNKLFSNYSKTKDGDIGTGILDVFDRYNFTVKEDEPLEKEVAIDPEMLGKVFENLLEVKDRKSKGTYYTPREIVHYMCQESLINYLVSELSECHSPINLDSPATLTPCHSRDLLGGPVPTYSGNPAPFKEDIKALIKFGETAVEHDMRVVSKGKETETYSFKLPENIRDHAGLIDEKLANIRVCDPAIGSGAFPLGMMSEIIRARNALTTYLGDEENRTMYNFKRHAIHNCLYGVDIDPGAVEIAKLRLWLSLMVDEEDIKHIKPLPNLDYKIMQGNSLLEEFEGIKLFDEKLISSKPFDETQIKEIKEKQSKLQKEFIDLHNRGKLTKAERTRIEAEQGKLAVMLKKITAPQKDSSQERMVYEVRAGEIAEKLKKLHEEFFEAYHINRKIQLKEQIDSPEGWNLELPEVLALMEKLRKAGTPLGEYVNGRFYYGIKTGLNEAFVINKQTRERLIAEDPKSEELIKPWLRDRDIKKWKAEWAGLYVIFTRRGTDIEKYPAIKKHLEQYRENLEPKKSSTQKKGRKPGPYKWFEIQDNIAYFKEFEEPKIIYPNITKTNIFAFDTTGIFTNQKCFIIPTNDLYLLAVLNSKIGTQWFYSTLPLLRGAFFEPSAMFMQHFPIAKTTDNQKAPIIECVQKIINIKQKDPIADVFAVEKEIDLLVYKLYDLSPEEIMIVEGRD